MRLIPYLLKHLERRRIPVYEHRIRVSYPIDLLQPLCQGYNRQFISQTELNCFKLLISISGVGPKAALSILSSSSPEDLALAVASGNEKALTIAPGIGKKLAQRILLELKDKLGKELGDLSGSADWGPVMSGGDSGGKLADITAALTVLGYAPNEINAALKGVDLEKLSV